MGDRGPRSRIAISTGARCTNGADAIASAEPVEKTRPDPEPEDEAVLVARAQRGDRDAFGQLYRCHFGFLSTVADRLLPDASEDLVHDVFIEAWRRIRSFDASRGAFRTWLSIILRSRALDRRRKAGRRPLELPLSPLPAPGNEASAAHARRDLERVFAKMSEKERRTVTLVYYSGFTLAEAAERLAEPVGTVKARMSRLLAQLRAGHRGEEGVDS